MNAVIVTLLTAASYITPTPEGDVNAFIRFMWATERCPGIAINYDKTLEQISDLGMMLKWDPKLVEDKILVDSRIAESDYNRDSVGFCQEVRALYQSYDPAHLYKVGVID